MSGVITLGDHRSYFLYRKETDMRKGYDSLCSIVLNEPGKQLTKGDHPTEIPFCYPGNNISLVTLTDWMKRGLPFHRQRGRVYFIRSEVVEYIKTKKIGPYKFSRRFSEIE